MTIQLPEKVKYIIEELERHGWEAYAVGGCVRDSLLGRNPNDWDITTSAKPEQVKEIFHRTVDTGIQHGTVTVMLNREGFEVTTYRIDGEYEDNRHPKEVIFTSDLVEDLKRRDFTINAMAYNPRTGLVDAFNGMEDMRNKCIRCVGNARERFCEDALRILRAVRFGAQLKFAIAEETRQAMKELSGNLSYISAERIQTELLKLLVSEEPQRFKEAYELGITGIILPEFDEIMTCTQENIHHCYTVGQHTLESLQHIEPDKVLRLALLFHDFGKPKTKTMDEQQTAHFCGHAMESARMAETIMKRLKFDNDTMGKVVKLVELHDHRPLLKKKSVKKLIVKSGPELFLPLLKVKYADTMAQSRYRREEKLAYLAELKCIYERVLEEKECISLKELAVNGKDMIALGVPQGKRMGEILKELFELVLEEPERNNREELLALVKERYL
ncbi:MAG: CCA tRNA nucleotidyltransferase [Lachnospiraceae bacterium]|nr:CCA tRNA nucleotidyltransferase [Lachnospiraceae bacterium]